MLFVIDAEFLVSLSWERNLRIPNAHEFNFQFQVAGYKKSHFELFTLVNVAIPVKKKIFIKVEIIRVCKIGIYCTVFINSK